MADVRSSDRSVALGVLLRIVKVAVLGVASGVAGGLAAIGFVELIHLSDRWLIAPLLAPDGFGFTDWLRGSSAKELNHNRNKTLSRRASGLAC